MHENYWTYQFLTANKSILYQGFSFSQVHNIAKICRNLVFPTILKTIVANLSE
jgi:hypothetical protein